MITQIFDSNCYFMEYQHSALSLVIHDRWSFPTSIHTASRRVFLFIDSVSSRERGDQMNSHLANQLKGPFPVPNFSTKLPKGKKFKISDRVMVIAESRWIWTRKWSTKEYQKLATQEAARFLAMDVYLNLPASDESDYAPNTKNQMIPLR